MTVSETHLGGLSIASGDVLLRKYRVERLIGEGGTGVVVLATHLQLEQRVAIKFLRQALASDELRTRFEREARAIAKIESDHVVLVLETGTLDDGAPYMVMEYLDGRDLAHVLKEDGPLPVERAVDCMLQVCEALSKAHAQGIVHRDLKPANILLMKRHDGSAHIKVVDFGISKFLDKKLLEGGDGKAHDVTVPFTVLGSPRYMAPEQVRNSKEVDHRVDLWSVGAVLFQLLTGKHAFQAEGNVQATLAVLTKEPLDLVALAPRVPKGLADVVKRCLAKDVAKRFQSAQELATALRPFASAETHASEERSRLADEPHRLVGVRVASSEPPRLDVGPGSVSLAPGRRDVDTEPRIRVAGASEPPRRSSPPRRPSEPAARSDGRASRGRPRWLGAFACAVVLLLVGIGAGLVARRKGWSAPSLHAIGVTATASQSRPLPLDAGKANP